MNIFKAVTIVGIICAISAPVLMMRPSIRKKYSQLDDRSLVHTKVNAERMWKFFICLAFFAPLPLSFAIAVFHNPRTTDVLSVAMILTVMGGIANFWVYWFVAGITKAELEYRAMKNIQEAPNKAVEAIGDPGSPQPHG